MEMEEKDFLKSYDMSKYERPSIATDMAIFTIRDYKDDNYRKLAQKRLNILMIKRGNHPFKDRWALAGGFVSPNESTEETAKRELLEETGIEDIYLEQLYTFSRPNRDPRGWIMSCSYMALVDSKRLNVKAGDDAKEAKWFTVDYILKQDVQSKDDNSNTSKKYYDLILTSDDGIVLKSQICFTSTFSVNGAEFDMSIISSDLAFDHATIIAYAIERLRNKLEYTTVAFNLLGETFTYTDLQMVYEVILGKKLLSANFRRKMKHLVEPVDALQTDNAGHRPAKLLKRKFI